MEQTERITEMERRMESAAKAVMELSAALDNYEEAQEAIAALDAYYGSEEWTSPTTRPDDCRQT